MSNQPLRHLRACLKNPFRRRAARGALPTPLRGVVNGRTVRRQAEGPDQLIESVTYDQRDMVGHVRETAPHLQQCLSELSDHPLVGEVRGVGFMAGIELVADKKTRVTFDKSQAVPAYCVARAQDHGMISRAVGDTVCVSPPLITTREQAGEIARRLKLALDDTLAYTRAN